MVDVAKRKVADVPDEYDYDRLGKHEGDEQCRIEERRKRRREIMSKYGTAEAASQHEPSPVAKEQMQGVVQRTADSAQSNLKKEDTARTPSYEEEDGFVEMEVDDDEDDVDDMFDLDSTPKEKKKKRVRVRKVALSNDTAHTGMDAGNAGLQDNWDDPDGYYRVILGEKLDKGRYQVFSILGRGIFAAVVSAHDLQNEGRDVAIKIVRRQETMYKAGMKEIGTLKKLAELDPDDRKHVVRLHGHFVHRGHLCMVFESLSMNLRDVVKRFGKDVGLNLQAVKTYAQQAFVALAHFQRAEIIHADIKPDNMLVNESKTLLKLCDMGSASSTSEMEITPYLVSRFYRAPEIILGQPYGTELDMWSMGCTLYELATGKILFPGKTNNHMLLLMQQLRGRITAKQLKKCQFSTQHYEDNNTFLSIEVDRSTGEEVIKRVNISHALEDLHAKLLPRNTAKEMAYTELRKTQQLIDLLNKMLELDPAKRIRPAEALAHPFVST
ncbi:Prp4p [Malassezia vespertilionis]|uniref:non-specific serine/threonine protein kinase n=1 Tax=Malassezia vespertilionis TaxID=2020962 RepID=A0A2N1J7Z7_9BASI|nr:Prp4p [Malassezia vespertilionis]